MFYCLYTAEVEPVVAVAPYIADIVALESDPTTVTKDFPPRKSNGVNEKLAEQKLFYIY